MKILYILSGTLAEGGATKSFLAMARSVSQEGNEVAVICPDEDGITPILKEEGFKIFVTPYRFATLPPISATIRDIARFFPRLIRDFFLNRSARKKILKFANSFKPDLIHDNTSVTDAGHYVAKTLGIPHVTHIREYGDKDFNLHIFNLKERLFAPNSWTIAITRDIAAYRNTLSSPRGEVIYNGIVSNNDFQYNPDKLPYLLYAGRIEEGKGIADLIKAYIAYCDEATNPLRLKIAGGAPSDSYLQEMKAILAGSKAESLTDWLGVRSDIAELASRATATIIPSLFEGFGRVMPEAMAAGSLCIGRNTGGTREQFDNGLNQSGSEIGLRFDNIGQLTEILLQLTNELPSSPFAENGKYKKMIADAQLTVRNLYSREASGQSILNFYKKILEK